MATHDFPATTVATLANVYYVTSSDDPTVNDDSSNGETLIGRKWRVGDCWRNTTAPYTKVLLDATPGAAVWRVLYYADVNANFDVSGRTLYAALIETAGKVQGQYFFLPMAGGSNMFLQQNESSPGDLAMYITNGSLDIEALNGGNVRLQGIDIEVLEARVAALDAFAAAASVYKTADQNLSVDAWTKLTFDVERFDLGGNFASNTFTAPTTGYIEIIVRVVFSTSATSANLSIAMYKNGTRIDTSRLWDREEAVVRHSAEATFRHATTAADTWEVYVRISSGGAPQVIGTGAVDSGTGMTEAHFRML